LSHELKNNIAIAVIESLDQALLPPQQRDENHRPRWTLKRIINWLETTYQVTCCRETVRQALKSMGYSWKKARKLLNKANPKKRASFVEILAELLPTATKGERTIIYIDEAHIHLDTDEGYGWSISGERFWISSSSPGLAKVSFFGVYIYNTGQVKIYPYEKGNSASTIDVLKKIREDLPEQEITIIWDGASYHRSHQVKEAATTLDIELQPLPAYSPDFMPVEHLWAWLREDVTYHACYHTEEQLITQVQLFQKRINAHPTTIADRLWVKTKLDPSEELLRFSN